MAFKFELHAALSLVGFQNNNRPFPVRERTFGQPRKPGSFTCARAPAKTLVPSGHVNPQILGVIRIAASLPFREEW